MTTIRVATTGDAAAVQQIAERAFSGYVATIGRRPAPMDADHAALITRGEVIVAVGLQIEGFAVRRFEGPRVLIETVAVLPEAAGRGIARTLVAGCETAGRRQGCTVAALYTNVRMTANLVIWPRLGYVEVARRAEDGFDRVFYEKRLE